MIALVLHANGSGRRVLFSDEALTLVRVSGWTTAQIGAALDDGRSHRLSEVAAFMQPQPGSSWRDTVRSLANEDAQHPPLYYLVERASRPMFGARALGAVIGMALVAATFWLAREAIPNRRAAWYAAALAAVSPVFVLYAQQLREYGMFALISAVSTAALIRAARTSSLRWWVAYACSMALALWCASFALLLPIAHAAIVLDRRAAWRPFAVSIVAALASWTPWALAIASHWPRVVAANEWSGTAIDPLHLLAKVAFNLSTTVFDAEYGNQRWIPYLAVSSLLVGVATLVALRRIRQDESRVGLALLLLTIVPILGADLMFGAHRAASTRYLMPAYVGIIMLLAALLARLSVRWGATAGTILIAGALISSVTATSATTWWDNHGNATTPAIVAALRAEPDPLLLFEGSCASLLALAFTSPSAARVRCRAVPSDARPGTFVLSPSIGFRREASAAGLDLAEVVRAAYPSALVGTFRGAGGTDDMDTLWTARR
ncbi:MAG TPA: glycosyltransferase family 39 protein [Candidatus Acidoferrum sp.]|nr:glycosyltransferase family 39 protein [Candidatus Acidoferrum sp.]